MKSTLRFAMLIISLWPSQSIFTMKKVTQFDQSKPKTQMPKSCPNFDDVELFATDPDELIASLGLEDPEKNSLVSRHGEVPCFMPVGQAVPVVQEKRKERCPLPLAPKVLTDPEIDARVRVCIDAINKIKQFDPRNNIWIIPSGERNVSVDEYLDSTKDPQVRAALKNLFSKDRDEIYAFVNCDLQDVLNPAVRTPAPELIALSDFEEEDDMVIAFLDVDGVANILCKKLRNDENFVGPKMGQSRQDYVHKYLKRSQDPQLQRIWNTFKGQVKEYDQLLNKFIVQFDNPGIKKNEQ